GDASDAHVDAGGDLPAQVGEGRADVTGPGQGAVALAARPRAAYEVDHLVLAGGPLPLVEGPGVQLRVEVADLDVGAEVVAVVVEVVDAVLRFGLVEPEEAHTEVGVAATARVPDELPGLGVGDVEEHARGLEGHLDA